MDECGTNNECNSEVAVITNEFRNSETKKRRKKDRVLDLMFCFVCSYVGNKVFLRNTTHGLKVVTRRYLHACVLKWKLLFLNNYY